MDLNIYDLQPRQRVSYDHYEYKLPGRLYHFIGTNDTKDMLSVGYIFVGYKSGYHYVVHQV